MVPRYPHEYVDALVVVIPPVEILTPMHYFLVELEVGVADVLKDAPERHGNGGVLVPA